VCGHDKLPASKGINQSCLPVFQQSWWVGIARGVARYREAQVIEDGVIVGSLPYIVERRKNRLGIPWGVSPHWSHLGGPVVSQALSNQGKANVLRQLIEQLPRKTSFSFICSPHTNDAGLIRQAFINAGFEHSKEITYSQTPESVGIMVRLNSKHRTHIKSAEKNLEVMEIGTAKFINFYEANLKAAGLKSYYPLSVASELIARGREGDPPQVRVIAARKRKEGSPYDAAIACAWDKERYYFWMSTRRRPSDGDKPHPDAIKLLIVKATHHAMSLGLTFDADGATTQGHENLYKEILKLQNTESRDVFDRTTKSARLFRKYRPTIKKTAAFLGLI